MWWENSGLAPTMWHAGRDAQRRDCVAQSGLPLRMGGKRRHKGRQRRGQRVVRGHHQKTHVVDDVLRREQRAVVVGGAAQLREQVFATLGTADRNLFREVSDDALAAPDAARHRRTRQWLWSSPNQGPPPTPKKRRGP